MSKFIREDLKDFIPYKPSEITYNYKMNANESPFKLAQEVKEELIEWISNSEDLNIYPETNSDTLRKEMCQKRWGNDKRGNTGIVRLWLKD